MNEKDRLETDALEILRDAVQPLGSGALSAALRERGHKLSEATVGRLLREFDMANYTQKAGFQGRILSAAGAKRLAVLTARKKSMEWGEEFAQILRGHDKEQLLEVLVARRAIESELAALAAQHATAEDLAKLENILADQRRTLDAGGLAAQQDVDFHNLIARMAKNRVLEAAVALIRQDTHLSPVLEYIRKHVHSLVYIDHEKIKNAIKSRQADQARQAMIEHINNLITDVERYWEITVVEKN